MDRLAALASGVTAADADQISEAFWATCHGGQLRAAEYLLDHGAALNWLPGWEQLTPLDAAARSAATDVITWFTVRALAHPANCEAIDQSRSRRVRAPSDYYDEPEHDLRHTMSR